MGRYFLIAILCVSTVFAQRTPLSVNGTVVANPNFKNSGSLTLTINGSDVTLTASGGTNSTIYITNLNVFQTIITSNIFTTNITSVTNISITTFTSNLYVTNIFTTNMLSGPGSVTNNNVVLWDGTDGKHIKDSALATDGAGALTTAGIITAQEFDAAGTGAGQVIVYDSTGATAKFSISETNLVFGPGDTNLLYRSGTDLIYTNGLNTGGPVSFTIKDGSAATASFAVAGNSARITGGNSVDLFDGTQTVRWGSSSWFPTTDNNRSLGLGVDQWQDLFLGRRIVWNGTTNTAWLYRQDSDLVYTNGAVVGANGFRTGTGSVFTGGYKAMMFSNGDIQGLRLVATSTGSDGVYVQPTSFFLDSDVTTNYAFAVTSTNQVLAFGEVSGSGTGTTGLKVSYTDTTNEVGILVRVNGTISRVLVGAPDSGGGGYRMLRVAN